MRVATLLKWIIAAAIDRVVAVIFLVRGFIQ